MKPNFDTNRKYYQPGADVPEKPGFFDTAPGGLQQRLLNLLAATGDTLAHEKLKEYLTS